MRDMIVCITFAYKLHKKQKKNSGLWSFNNQISMENKSHWFEFYFSLFMQSFHFVYLR